MARGKREAGEPRIPGVRANRAERPKQPAPRTAEPWERQPEDTDASWAAFQVFRDLPPERRTLLGAWKAAAQARGRTVNPPDGHAPTNWRQWHVRHDWASRAAAWDNEQDRRIREELIRQRAGMARRQAQLGQLLQSKAAQAAQTLATAEVNAHGVAALADTGSKLERLALGEPTERTDAAVSLDAGAGEERLQRIVAAFREAALLAPPDAPAAPEAGAPVPGDGG
jgi:hypothetical protein